MKKNILIEIQNLSVQFGDQLSGQVLQDMSLILHERDKIAIIGETGSGKSILLLAILGLLPKSASVRGNVWYQGEDLLNMDRKRLDQIRGCDISYIPQGSGSSMNPLMQVGRQIGEPLVIHKNHSVKQAMEAAVRLLQRFNIGDEEKRVRSYPHTFSGGMKQRALIGMGISAGANILFADEPTKGLDDRRIHMVEECFALLEDKTWICVTHDLNFARTIGRKISVMYSSFQVEYGGAEDIFNNPYHPYTKDILRAMPENGLQHNRKFVEKLSLIGSGCRYQHLCEEASSVCQNTPPMIEKENGRKVRCWKYA